MSSNRTFMELKCYSTVDKRLWQEGSNRTFMELKYFAALIRAGAL